MDKLKIYGPSSLKGSVEVSASKNASLPLLAATLLFPGKLCMEGLPKLSDIAFFINILESLGVKSEVSGEKTFLDASHISNLKADYELVRKMRASVLVLGPLLSRFGHAIVSLPGGCAIGARPVDLHLKGMEAMGAKIEIKHGYIEARAEKLKGSEINLDFPSVGATENLMMAAVYAEGETIISNAAMEPEITDLAHFLMEMGVKIEGVGTQNITIEGGDVKRLTHPNLCYRPIGDRIEAATFVIAALMTNSEVSVKGFKTEHLMEVFKTLKEMGAQFEISENEVKVLRHSGLRGVKVETAPYPGFPTDVQAQLMALMGISSGNSIISEKIFENRFMHVPELNRMGMEIELDGANAFITGVKNITSAPVMCTDLRASAALVLSALVGNGETEISRIYHLDRGYEKLEEKFSKLGVRIERVK